MTKAIWDRNLRIIIELDIENQKRNLALKSKSNFGSKIGSKIGSKFGAENYGQ